MSKLLVVILGTALVVGLLMAILQEARAQEDQRIEPVMNPAPPKVIDGSKSPQDVPYFMKYGLFIRRYESGFRNSIVAELSSNDDAILASTSANQENWEVDEENRYQSDYIRICANRQGKDAITLARETDRAANDSNNRRAAQYRNALASLSDSGRKQVEDFVEGTLTPGIKTSIGTNEEFAMADPDGFLEWLDIRCHRALTGVYPEEVQRARDQLTRQLESEFGPPSESGATTTFGSGTDNSNDTNEENK